MDPYLEASWTDVHSTLVPKIRSALQPQLPAGLRAVVEREVLLEEEPDGKLRSYRPDIHVHEGRGVASAPGSPSAAAVLPVPFRLHLPRTTFRQKRVEIVDAEQDHRVVTVIEVLSPANKMPGPDNRRYRRKLDDFARAGVSVVEIDLLCGTPRDHLEVQQADLPEERRSPYLICVREGWVEGDWLVYDQPLRKRLSAVSIPLRSDDAPATLDLQPLMDELYAEAQCYRYIDYTQPPSPKLNPDDTDWARSLVAKWLSQTRS
jgi:hypothetical protein